MSVITSFFLIKQDIYKLEKKLLHYFEKLKSSLFIGQNLLEL